MLSGIRQAGVAVGDTTSSNTCILVEHNHSPIKKRRSYGRTIMFHHLNKRGMGSKREICHGDIIGSNKYENIIVACKDVHSL